MARTLQEARNVGAKANSMAQHVFTAHGQLLYGKQAGTYHTSRVGHVENTPTHTNCAGSDVPTHSAVTRNSHTPAALPANTPWQAMPRTHSVCRMWTPASLRAGLPVAARGHTKDPNIPNPSHAKALLTSTLQRSSGNATQTHTHSQYNPALLLISTPAAAAAAAMLPPLLLRPLHSPSA
jgi:hypothetical protein